MADSDVGAVLGAVKLRPDELVSLLISTYNEDVVIGSDGLWTDELRSLLVVDSNSDSGTILGAGKLRPCELASLFVSVLNKDVVLRSDVFWEDAPTSSTVSKLDSVAVLGDGRLKADEVISLMENIRTSSVELAELSGTEEMALLDKSGISIDEVVGVGILSLPSTELEAPESMLSNCMELGSCVDLEAVGNDVESSSTLLVVDGTRAEDDESSGVLRSVMDEGDGPVLLDSVISVPSEIYNDGGSSEGSCEIVGCAGSVMTMSRDKAGI